jgi:hypothetical protein
MIIIVYIFIYFNSHKYNEQHKKIKKRVSERARTEKKNV